MNVLYLIAASLLALALSLALTPLVRRLAIAVGAIDLPGERKIHTLPVPRMGGIAVIVAVVTVISLIEIYGVPGLRPLPRITIAGLLLGLLPILVVSIIDDIRPVRPLPKFAAHLSGAAIAVYFGIRLDAVIHLFETDIAIGWLAVPISILWIAGLTSAFNIVDGLDGLSAGLATISALSLAGVSLLVGRHEMAVAAAILAGALLGFLPFNLHPAKIFLGDTGSAAIGFFLACLALRGGSTTSAGMAVLVPLVVLGLPLAETVVSMARRFLHRAEGAGSGVFSADRGHFHHRLLELGLDHRKAVLTLYGIGVVLATAGLLSVMMTTRSAAFLLITLLLAAFIGVSRLRYDEFAFVRRGVLLRLYDSPVLHQSIFVVFFDIGLVLAAAYGAIVLKYDDWGLVHHRDFARSLLMVMPGTGVAIFSSFKLYRGAWKLASIDDFVRAALASLLTAAVGLTVVGVVGEWVSVTFSAIYALLLLLLVVGSRMSYRVLANWMERSNTVGTQVVIYGAGVGGTMALRELLTKRQLGMRPVGFIDDDPRKRGKHLQGFPIFGTQEVLEGMLASGAAAGVIVASERVMADHLDELRRMCTAHGAVLRHFRADFQSIDDPTDGEAAAVAALSFVEDGPKRRPGGDFRQ
jgi:UDP-GlcNAc:undecaprenyl-phosphate GlcNAc-1-phosphate transferase